jgi:hypothetical protein
MSANSSDTQGLGHLECDRRYVDGWGIPDVGKVPRFSVFYVTQMFSNTASKTSNVAIRTNFQLSRPDVTANLVSAGDLTGSTVNIGNYTNWNVINHHFTILTKIVNILQHRLKLGFVSYIALAYKYYNMKMAGWRIAIFRRTVGAKTVFFSVKIH